MGRERVSAHSHQHNKRSRLGESQREVNQGIITSCDAYDLRAKILDVDFALAATYITFAGEEGLVGNDARRLRALYEFRIANGVRLRSANSRDQFGW